MQWLSRALKRSEVFSPGPQRLGWLTDCREGGGWEGAHVVGTDAVSSQPGLPPPAVRPAVITCGYVPASSIGLRGMGQLGLFVPNN